MGMAGVTLVAHDVQGHAVRPSPAIRAPYGFTRILIAPEERSLKVASASA